MCFDISSIVASLDNVVSIVTRPIRQNTSFHQKDQINFQSKVLTIGEKLQVTAIFIFSVAGTLLPTQLIHKRKLK